METITNQLRLQGTIEEAPVLDHNVFGEGIYRTRIKVTRTSGTDDVLLVLIPERNLPEGDVAGKRFLLQGQIRTCTKQEDGVNHLYVNAFTQSLSEAQDENEINSVHLTGTLCKVPVYRTTPFGREISDLMLAVNRSYGKSDYIPCIAWGRTARYVSRLNVGDKVELQGRFQSREYVKSTPDGKSEEKMAYEVSVGFLKLIEEKHENTEPQEQDTAQQTEE